MQLTYCLGHYILYLGQISEVKTMTNKEKEIMEVFEELIPMLNEEEKHDLIVSGRALMLFKATQKKEKEQKAG